MRDHGFRYSFCVAPGELRSNGGVSDRNTISGANDRPAQRRAVSHVDLNAGERLLLIMDVNEIGDVKDHAAARSDAITDGRRVKGVLDREGLKHDVVDAKRSAGCDQGAIGQRKAFQRTPGIFGGVDAAGCAVLQSPGVIGMGVGEQNDFGMYVMDLAQPVGAAIDHDAMAVIGDLERGMHAMQATLDVDLTARSQELQFHNG